MKSILKTIVALVIAAVISTVSAKADVPQITKYYPDNNPDAPYELKHNAKAYVYFNNGAQIEYAKARIVQNGQELGTCVYRKSSAISSTATLNQALEENAAMALIQGGVFALEFYEVCYTDDGSQLTYSDTENLLGTVYYKRNALNGTVVEEYGHSDKLIKSYYPAGGDEGYKTYVFSKAVKGDNIHVYFSYGYGDQTYLTSLPWTLSEDGLTLTVDFRGKCYNSDSLAPGVTFYDVTGEVLPPPSAITLVVENLICTDGSKIESQAVSLDGQHSATVEGKIHQNYNYLDITIPTPQITAGEFYDSKAPAQKYAEPNDATDKVDLTMTDLSYLVSANVKFFSAGVTAVVPFGEITKTSTQLKIDIPESIRKSGSKALEISLENVVLTVDDGAPHVIAPLTIGEQVTEAFSIADLKNFAENADVILNVMVNGVKVTMSQAGYIFMEDATGGLQILTVDNTSTLTAGTLLKGRLQGRYLGNSTFMIDESASQYIVEEADVTAGYEPESIDDVLDGTFDNCLVTIDGSVITIAYDEDENTAIIGNKVIMTLDLVENAIIPDEFKVVTGILYNDPFSAAYLLIVRSQQDINHGEVDSLGSVVVNDSESQIYNISGMRVPSGKTVPGIYIVNGKKLIIR